MTNVLSDTNWNEEWIRAQQLRKHADNASFWDDRSKNFGSKEKPSDYSRCFLEYANLLPGESVLDMGCGNGALAIPLAKAGHPVIACDFSQGMLDALARGLEKEGLDTVDIHRFAWDDDWQKEGIAKKSVDVCFASRSMAANDMGACIKKLSETARRKVCITLSTGASPRSDEAMLRELGIPLPAGRDFWYALNILIQMGIRPELRYINSARHDSYDSEDEAFENLSKMIYDLEAYIGKDEVSSGLVRLREWLKNELIPNPYLGTSSVEPTNKTSYEPDKALMLRKARVVSWAFISWDV